MTTEGNDLKDNFEDFFEQPLWGFVIATPKGVIERANSTVAKWTGRNVDDLKGIRFSDILTIGGKIYYETHLAPLLRMQGYFDEVVLELKNSNGEKIRVLGSALERRDNDGKPLFIRYIIQKASDRLQYEQNLQLAKSEAESELAKQINITTVREQLIAVLGHDLRNPLAAITMVAELLDISEKDEDFPQLVATLRRSSLRMSELVTNIMDFATTRLGEGIVLTKKRVLLKPVLQQIVDELSLVNKERKIITSFKLDMPVECDPNRIGQLMSNLLANAITHGAKDVPIYISATNEGGVLKLFVTNSGDPIPISMHHNIFEPFTREQNTHNKQGLGLGLYISKEIAVAHGGTLTVTSDEKETTFTFQM